MVRGNTLLLVSGPVYYARFDYFLLMMQRWIDKKAGICGFYGSQLMGIRDQGISKAMFEKFERVVYEEYEMRSVE